MTGIGWVVERRNASPVWNDWRVLTIYATRHAAREHARYLRARDYTVRVVRYVRIGGAE